MDTREVIENLYAAPFIDPHVPKHQYHPDYIIPTTEYRTSIPNGAIRIEVPQNCDPTYLPESVVSLFRRAVKNSPEKIAITTKRNDKSVKWSYLQYLNDVETAAKGFIKLGLIPFHGVSILSNNSPEWAISYLAAIFCGGFALGIYTSNSSEACYHILNDSSANILLVENEHQLEKIKGIRHKLANLKAIVQFNGQPNQDNVISWQELLQIGKSLDDEVLEKRIKGLAVNQCCGLIYTSGTTGNPKGVMLSHDNVITMVKSNNYKIWHVAKFGRLLSYLPLSHIMAVAIDIFLAILTESTVNFARPNALKGDLTEDLIECKPTFFVGVPRVYEKLKVKMEVMETYLSPEKKHQIASARNQEDSATIFNDLKTAIGFDKTQLFFSAGAPISINVLEFFKSYGITILEAYGLSESSGAHTSNAQQYNRLGSVGNIHNLKHFEMKILNPDSDGSGEIMLSGRNIFMGYLNLEEQTTETLDEDNWLHTGDIGKIDKDGFLFITGRIKELIITAGGENIAPILIEEHVKKLLPVLSNCMLIGDKRKYLTMLLTLNTKVNSDTMEPIDELNVTAVEWCNSVGSTAKRVSEILHSKDPKVMAAIQRGIDEYNEKFAISGAQKIQKWTILSQDFCIHNGTLGPTSKLKRPVAINKYADIIEAMYSS